VNFVRGKEGGNFSGGCPTLGDTIPAGCLLKGKRVCLFVENLGDISRKVNVSRRAVLLRDEGGGNFPICRKLWQMSRG